MGRASGVGARCWGTPVEFGCLLTYRQLISGCRAVRNLSPTGALFLFHDVRLYDPERRLVRGPPRKGLGMCRRVTYKWRERVRHSQRQRYGGRRMETSSVRLFKTAEGPLSGSQCS
jgi:hypothetical protein